MKDHAPPISYEPPAVRDYGDLVELTANFGSLTPAATGPRKTTGTTGASGVSGTGD